MIQGIFLPRGIRNHNPGNIRLGKQPWLGQKAEQGDAAFVEFTDALHGLRALMRLLLTYHVKYNLDTVQSVINRYAPPSENATDRYAHAVARAMRVRRDEVIDLLSPPVLKKLAAAIVRHENGPPPGGGADWYPSALYEAAAKLALGRG